MATAARAERRAPGPTTVEEFDRWTGLPGEIIDGVWTPKYPDGKVTGSGTWHGMVGVHIGRLLSEFVYARRLGIVVGGETAFLLRPSPVLIRCADAAYVAAARLSAGIPAGTFPGAPDLAVEVWSIWDKAREVEQKVAHYLQHGTRAVWEVAPKPRAVTVHRPGTAAVRLSGDDVLDGGDVLPGFAVPVSAVFSVLDLTF